MTKKQQSKLEALCEGLLAAKAVEAKATEERIAVEQEILAITGLPDEGSQTTDAGEYKCRVEQTIKREIDPVEWAGVGPQIPEILSPISIIEKFKIDSKGVRYLKEKEPGYYKLLCKAMTEKPAKPSVRVDYVREVK